MICFFTSDDILIQILPLLICVSPQNGHCPKAPKVLVLYHGEWRTNQSWYIDISNIWYIEIIVVHLQLHILQRQVTWADSNFNADNAFSISGTNQMATAAQLVTIWWNVWHSLCFNNFWRVSFEQGHQQQVHLLQCLNAELEWWWLGNKQVALLTTCMTWNDVWCMMYDVCMAWNDDDLKTTRLHCWPPVWPLQTTAPAPSMLFLPVSPFWFVDP